MLIVTYLIKMLEQLTYGKRCHKAWQFSEQKFFTTLRFVFKSQYSRVLVTAKLTRIFHNLEALIPGKLMPLLLEMIAHTVDTLENLKSEQNEEVLGISDALNILLHTESLACCSRGCRVGYNLIMTEQQLLMFYLSYQGK